MTLEQALFEGRLAGGSHLGLEVAVVEPPLDIPSGSEEGPHNKRVDLEPTA